MRAALFVLLVSCTTAPSPTPAEDGPTWHGEVAALVGAHCSGCHTDGALAGQVPFDSYTQAAPWSASMAMHTTSRTMPPFPADTTECANPWGWTSDRRLPDDAIATFAAWSDAGAPEGDADRASPITPPAPVPTLARVDQELGPQVPFVVPTRDVAEDTFVCWVADPGLTEDGLLEGVEVVPDATEVVHHVIVAFADPSADDLAGPDGWYPCPGGAPAGATQVGGWVPGSAPIVMPEGTAARVPAGSRLVVQMHYHGAAGPISDATGVQLQWADGPRDEAYLELRGNASNAGQGLEPGPADRGDPEFRIPAGAVGHTETMRYLIDEGAGSYGVFLTGNHLHRIGTRMRVWVEPADGSADVCLLDTPRWDFDWQLMYTFDLASGRAPVVHDGDTLVLECTYDNSLANPGTQRVLSELGLDAPVDIGLGEGTLDEMCIFVVGAVPL